MTPTSLTGFLPGLAADLGRTLLHSLWQGALVALAAWVLLAALHRARPELRYALGCLALAACLAWPAATFAGLRAQRSLPAAVLTSGGQAAHGGLGGGPATAGPVSPERLRPALPWLGAAWAAGVLVLGLRLLGGWLWLRRALARSEAAGHELRAVASRLARRWGMAPPDLRLSADVESPLCFGWWKPVVLLPAACALNLDPRALEALLAHELWHLRRLDYLANWLQSLVDLALFHHPAVRWLSARVRLERELCCDAAAVAVCGDPRFYAALLDRLDDLRRPALSTQPALAAQGGSLMIRIQRLLGARPTFPLPSFAGALAVLGSCALLAAAPDRVPAPAQTAAPAAAPAGPDAQLLRLADEVAAAEGVDRDLVRAVIQVESGWNPAAVSPHGSQGLMQLMPRTSQRFGVQDPMDPRQNVQGGVRYLRFLQDRYQGNVALVVAAYNAGEEAVDQARGIPAAEETRRYVPAVLDLYLRKAVR